MKNYKKEGKYKSPVKVLDHDPDELTNLSMTDLLKYFKTQKSPNRKSRVPKLEEDAD